MKRKRAFFLLLLSTAVVACDDRPVDESDAGSVDAGSVDAGSVDAGPVDAGPITADCSSNVFWTEGTKGSELMTPGQDCIACHATHPAAPVYALAGTVYGAFHDPDDCNGVAGAKVEITDGNMVKHTYVANAAGNFFSSDVLTPPIRALVRANGHVSAMVSPQDSTNCNSCHTKEGMNSSPGRIAPQ